MVEILFGVCGAASVAAAFLVNRDVFSPAKIYLLVLHVFLGAIYTREYSAEVQLTFACLLTIGVFAVILETRLGRPFSWRDSSLLRPVPRRIVAVGVIVLWVASVVPIAGQLYLVNLFGGVEGYIASIGLRVLKWRGLGPLRTAINIVFVLNAIYFCLLASSRRASMRSWVFYAVHLSIVAVIALLSGSRGNLVSTFFLLALVYNYVRRAIPVRVVAVLAPAGLALVVVLGVARNGYRWTGDGLTTGLDNASWEWKSGSVSAYGLRPLDLVYSRPPERLQYGLTFATAVTNFVPRRVWPGKPDPGGLVLTKDYMQDRWGGASNLSPGIIAESVLNFGQLGALFGLLCMVLVVFGNYRLYVKLLRLRAEAPAPRLLRMTLVYGLFVPASCGLMFMEFTNTVMILGTRLVPLVGLLSLIYGLAGLERAGARYSEHSEAEVRA